MDASTKALLEVTKALLCSDSLECESQESPYTIGECYFIRTVTMYYVGRLLCVTKQELVLTDASWVADTGRFADALLSGSLTEVEPFPRGKVIVGRGAVIDVSVWSHKLPENQK